MAIGKAISLFLLDGTPDGRVVCELFNWTGKGYRIPRNLLRASSDRCDLHKAGIYILFGHDPEGDCPIAYVGEGEEAYCRIVQHESSDFWNEVLVFVSKDENLNKAHIKFLENSCVLAAKAVGRYRLQNGNTPNCPAISEAEQAVMLEFFDNLKLLTGALGYKLFESFRAPESQPPEGKPVAGEFTIRAARGADAKALLTNEGLVVVRGSKATPSVVDSASPWIVNLRKRLQETSILVPKNEVLVFARDYLFSSPSAAAAVVMGRNADGRSEWRDAEQRSIADLEGA